MESPEFVTLRRVRSWGCRRGSYVLGIGYAVEKAVTSKITDFPLATPIPWLGKRLDIAKWFGLNVPCASLTSQSESGASPYHCRRPFGPIFSPVVLNLIVSAALLSKQ